jgi:hypothetical protein
MGLDNLKSDGKNTNKETRKVKVYKLINNDNIFHLSHEEETKS